MVVAIFYYWQNLFKKGKRKRKKCMYSIISETEYIERAIR